MKKIYRRILQIFFILLLILICAVGIVYYLFTKIPRYQELITQKISEQLQKPIKIGQIKAYWHGLIPWLELNDIAVFDEYTKKQLLNISKVKLSIYILPSLLHQRIIPSGIIMDGGQFIIRQLPDKNITINSIQLPLKSSSSKSADLKFFSTINYNIDNIDVTWQGLDNSTITFHNLKIIYNHGNKTIYSKKAILFSPSMLEKPIIFDHFSSDFNFYKKFNSFNLSFFNLQFKNYFANISGKVDLDFLPDKNNIDLKMDFTLDNVSKLNDYIIRNSRQWCGDECIKGKRISGEIFLSGPINQFPFKDKSGYIRGNIYIDDGDFDLLDKQLLLEHIYGNVIIDYPTISATGLKGEWLGKPIDINVHMNRIDEDNIDLFVDMRGILSLNKLAKIRNRAYLNKFAEGVTPLKAQWQWQKHNKQTKSIISFTSNLQGLAVLLPLPLKKPNISINPSQLRIILSDNQMILTGNYDNKLSAVLLLKENSKNQWTITRGNIVFGQKEASDLCQNGINIQGKITYFDLTELFPYFSENKSANNQSSFTNQFNIKKINLNFDKLIIAGFPIDHAKVEAKSRINDWLIKIKSHDVNSDILIPNHLTNKFIKINFNHFSVTSNRLKSINHQNGSNKSTFSPEQIPSLDVRFRNFYYDNDNLGQIHFITKKGSHALYIQKFYATSPTMVLNLTGYWNGRVAQRTMLQGIVNTSDFGDFLNDWNITDSVKGSEGTLKFTLSWPGPLYKLNLPKLNGQFKFTLDDGVILDVVDSKIDMIGKMLNLVSIDTLEHLLSQPFNFISPKKKGFDFSIKDGKFIIVDGIVEMEQFKLDGRLAKVKTEGEINLQNQSYNLYITVNPLLGAYVSSPLLIAGGPLAAGIVWISDKLMDSIFSSFFRQIYHVTGPWIKPNYEKVSSVPKRNENTYSQSFINYDTLKAIYK